MRYLLAFVVAFTAAADGQPRGTPHHDHHESNARADAASQSSANAEAVGGSATATGGSASVEHVEGGTGHGGSVDFNYSNRRSAPPVSVWSSPSTADFMVCIGLGGSNASGAATGALCYLQKDLYAMHRSDWLAARGNDDAAKAAYCSRKLHWRDFGSEAACLEQYEPTIPLPPPPPAPEPEVSYEDLTTYSDYAMQSYSLDHDEDIAQVEQRVDTLEAKLAQRSTPRPDPLKQVLLEAIEEYGK